MNDEVIAYAKTQDKITASKLEVKFHFSYVKSLLVIGELTRMGIINEYGEVIHEQEC